MSTVRAVKQKWDGTISAVDTAYPLTIPRDASAWLVRAGSHRDVQFGSPSDEAGFMTMWARVYATDGAAIEQRVEQMAHSVCDADPRTADERRADALAPAITHTDFACQCGQPDCDGATGEPPAKTAVVYVVADEKSVDAATAESAASESTPVEAAPSEPAATDPEPAPCSVPPAFVLGAGVLPTALLAGILERARISEVRHPGGVSPPEPRYIQTVYGVGYRFTL